MFGLNGENPKNINIQKVNNSNNGKNNIFEYILIISLDAKLILSNSHNYNFVCYKLEIVVSSVQSLSRVQLFVTL